MFNELQIFKTASGLASHASHRQTLIARNIANADTAGYSARDLPAFGERLATGLGRGELRTVRAGHIARAPRLEDPAVRETVVPGNASPNGNSVSLETEMMKSTEVKQRHDLALAAYRSGLDLLRAAIGTNR